MDAEWPLMELMAAIAGDGQPIAQVYGMFAADKEREPDQKLFGDNVKAFFGGFHTLMKFHNARRELFEELLTAFIEMWRDTIKRILWILNPSDPRQLENEFPLLVLCHYLVASINLCNSRGGKPMSPVDVYEFMKDRAQAYPICMLAMLELQIAELAKVSLFMSCVWLMMPLFSVTHKTDYMRLCCNLLLW
jgi:hypothetical protein